MRSWGELSDALRENLRRLRSARGLSLSWVAKTSGIGKATLSELESAHGNPTLRTLFDLAQALSVPPSELLSPPENEGLTVLRRADTPPVASPVFETRFIASLEAGGAVLELFHIDLPPTPEPQQSPGHLGREHLIVTHGELHIGPAGEIATLGAGDYVSFDGSQPHSYWTTEAVVHAVLLLEHHRRSRISSA